MATFTVCGLQRSGTTFTEQCLRNNFHKISLENTKHTNRIWKHDFDVDRKILANENKNFIHIYKHPYSWLESIMKNCVDVPRRWPRCIADKDTKPFMKIHHDLDLEKLCHLWNDHTQFWVEVSETRPVTRIKFEDFVASPDATRSQIEEVAESYDLKMVHPKIHLPDRVSQSDPFTNEAREKYKNIQLNRLTWRQLEVINDTLNKRLVNSLGYKLFLNEEVYVAHKK